VSTTAEGVFSGPYLRPTLGIVATVFLVAFEAMAVATAMPVAVRDLQGLDLYAWAFSAFLTAALYGMVLAGEMCDRRGPRLPFLLGVGAFGVGLLVAGLATSMPTFVLGRAVQGLGAGINIVVIYVVVARAYPETLRPRIFAALSSAWVLPSIVGPLLAGWVADHLSWRLVFLGVPPLIVPAVLLMLPKVIALDGPSPDAVPRSGRRRLALGAAAGAALLQYAGQHLVWSSLLLLVAGLALLVPTVPRLLPPGTLRAARGLPTVVGMRGVLAGAFFGAETFVPLMLVTERGLSTTQAGLSLTGGALGWALGSWYQGRPSTRLPRHVLIRRGCALLAAGIGTAALVLVPVLPVWLAAVGWAVAGLGMGLAMASVGVLLLQLSPPAEQGANSAALQVSDGLGSVLLIGLGGALYAALRTEPGQDAATFALLYAVMVAVAVLGVAVAGRVRAPAVCTDSPDRPPRHAPDRYAAPAR
jgi:MFS family permease